MISLELVLAGVILVSLTFYALFGGADFGAGVLSLFASGPRRKQQREAIARSIAPIWEANHVWLILAVTVLFTAFPPVFAVISTALHIPLVLMLIGIVLRGSAFAFRTNDVAPRTRLSERANVWWEHVFAFSSVVTPILLGVTIGAIASGRIDPDASGFYALFVRPWLAPFPLVVGLLALALFTLLAAVYLVLETQDPVLREDFRRRAFMAAGVAVVVAGLAFAVARSEAGTIHRGLVHSPWGDVLLGAAVLSAVGGIAALAARFFRTAAVCAVLEVTLVVWGWALSQYPYLVEPDFTIFNAAAPAPTLTILFASLVAGALVLFPSLWYLYRIFKGHVL